MAQTELHKYTVAEKLNKMDVDIIDITATLTTDGTSGDLMFDVTEIANAVAVNAGSGILQSVVAVISDHATDESGDGANITGDWIDVWCDGINYFVSGQTNADGGITAT